jgi:hypothetical protein
MPVAHSLLEEVFEAVGPRSERERAVVQHERG